MHYAGMSFIEKRPVRVFFLVCPTGIEPQQKRYFLPLVLAEK